MIRILFEDNHLLGAVKEPGLLSQADDSGAPDMLTLLKEDLKSRHAKPGNVFLGLVHRLDRPVGGVMIFAKTSKAASRLSEAMRSGMFRKTYLAVARGKFPKQEEELTHYLIKDEKTNTVRCVQPETLGSKEAKLAYLVRASAGDLSLLEIRLYTGRPHQIRVQLSKTGHPIVGDHKYGSKEDLTAQDDPALWSLQLEFKHPTKDETIVLRELPPNRNPWNLFALK